MKAYILYYNNGEEEILQKAFKSEEEAIITCSRWNAQNIENGYYKLEQYEI